MQPIFCISIAFEYYQLIQINYFFSQSKNIIGIVQSDLFVVYKVIYAVLIVKSNQTRLQTTFIKRKQTYCSL